MATLRTQSVLLSSDVMSMLIPRAKRQQLTVEEYTNQLLIQMLTQQPTAAPARKARKPKAMTPAQAAVARLEAKSDEKFSREDRRILEGFYDAIQEWKEIKAGRKQLRSMDDFLAEVEQKEAAGYYD